eukprot:scaffold20575_cov93-Isochrysis_galbana.AAC.2
MADNRAHTVTHGNFICRSQLVRSRPAAQFVTIPPLLPPPPTTHAASAPMDRQTSAQSRLAAAPFDRHLRKPPTEAPLPPPPRAGRRPRISPHGRRTRRSQRVVDPPRTRCRPPWARLRFARHSWPT